MKKYLTSPHLVPLPLLYYIAFATAAEMTDAEKAAEEAAMKSAEQEMMESAAPYTPPEGKLITFFLLPHVRLCCPMYMHLNIYLTLCNYSLFINNRFQSIRV